MSTKKQEVILANEPNPAPATFSFADMSRMAVSIAKSGLFGVKDADQALSLMMISQAEGKHPALIARDYNIINGRPAKNAEAMLRDFQASGGRVEWHELSDKMASATFTHPLSVKPVKIDWDMARAKTAGLVKPGGMYEKYGRAMLRSRCVAEGVRSTAPAATSGFYTPEEARDIEEAPPAPVSIQQAVTEAVQAPAQSEVEAYVNAMDVTSIDKLKEAFAAAWQSTKEPKVRARYKAVYDDMAAQITEAAARDLAFDTAEVPL